MSLPDPLVKLPIEGNLWERCFTLAPLVVIGTREPDGGHDLAPKHMATPLGWGGWFGFVCTPRHRTWDNAARTGVFTVSFLPPSRILDATFAASPRESDGSKPGLQAVPTLPAQEVEGVLVEGCDLYLECTLDRVIGGFGDNGLIIGRVVAAHAHRDAVRDPETDDAELLLRHPLLAYVAPDRFAVVDRTQRLPLHLGFSR